ncbi:arginine/serine-rich coiled-coil protein 2 isoform X2 [Clupea harengus]|uniref:Arginine/serine-rich coiled-coil protein 2 n=1 Tax=Clupea harengus TaxID=7950 RepID=A0A8M1KJH2_CLUHA|nr:arginine/serine-rich coiled-coil protein 2 isoform X2 [Clupea harengus]
MASDADMNEMQPRSSSPDRDKRRPSVETLRSPRNSKHHNSRSRSRSRERKHKSSDKKHRRSRSRSKEARRRDLAKASKLQSRLEEAQQDERGRERLSEENGEERHRRKDRKASRGRSYSRSRSRERRHRSRSRDKKRSRSRDRRSKSREKKSSRSKHRHRSRSRSKSREKKKRTEKNRRKSRSRTASPPAFRGRNTAMDAQEALARRLERAKKLQEQKEKELLEKQQNQQQEETVAGKEQTPVEAAAASAPLLSDAVAAAASAAAVAAASNPVLNVAALLASGTQVTPQFAMAAQMAALQARTLAETGIAVPSYYNPSAVNPMKFAEQEKKRKLLWTGKKEGHSKNMTAELWEKLNFGNNDQNAKFRKLMGIKDEEEAGASRSLNDDGLKTLQHQEEMFRNLDVQYEMARSQTHTQRGMGLGFGSAFSSRGMDAL